jgi:hypothetical protein
MHGFEEILQVLCTQSDEAFDGDDDDDEPAYDGHRPSEASQVEFHFKINHTQLM